MSADVLRRAATRIRHDVEFGQAYGDDTVLSAVSAWLDREADLHDALDATGALLQSAADQLGMGELRIQFNESANGMAASTMPQALAVARAYLGEAS